MGQWNPYCRFNNNQLINMLQLLITFVVFGFSACGLGLLYMVLIREGQLFSFMQGPINFFGQNEGVLSNFIHKSIGGCEICTIQRFADISFIILILTSPIHLHFLLWFFLYCMFGGLVFFATALIKKDEPGPTKTTQKLDL